MTKMTITSFMTGIKNWVLAKQQLITALIPSQATAQNQLADKAYVNSSISTATATFCGTYNCVSDLSLAYNATHAQIAAALGTAVSTADNNDYAFVQVPTSTSTPTEIAKTEKYKFNGSIWGFEYELNSSGFTSAQWAAINSGATLELIGKLRDLPTNAELINLLNAKQDTINDLADIRSGATAGSTAVQPNALAAALVQTVAEAGVFDVTANNDGATFDDLEDLLSDEDLATLIPEAVRAPGMSMKFVRTSDNKYVQFRYLLEYANTTAGNTAFVNVDNWQGVDVTPIAGSQNLVKSGGVASQLTKGYLDLAKKLGTLAIPKNNGTDITNMITGHKYDLNYKYISSNTYKCQTITVNPSKIYRIIADNHSWPDILSLALLDANDNCLGGQENVLTQTDFIFVGVSKIVLSTIATNNNVHVIEIDNNLDLPAMLTRLVTAETNISNLQKMFDWNKIPMRDIEDIVITGNLFKNAKLVKDNGYIYSIKGDSTIAYVDDSNYKTYLLPVDSSSTYLFTEMRFLVKMSDETHAASGTSISQNITTIDSTGCNYILFSFNTDYHPVSSIRIGIGSLQQNAEYNIPLLKILKAQIKDFQISASDIADDSIVIDKIEFKDVIESANKANPAACVYGKYIDMNDGKRKNIDTSVPSLIRYATDYIPVSVNGLYCSGYELYGNVGAVAVYDSNKQYIRGYKTISGVSDGHIYTYQDGDAYVRWTVSKSSVETPNLYIIEGTQAGQYTPYVAPKKLIKLENLPQMDTEHIENGAVTSEKLASDVSIPSVLPAISLCGKGSVKVTAASIAAGGGLLQITSVPQNIKQNGRIVSCFCKFTNFYAVRIGFGDGSANSGSLQIIVNTTGVKVNKNGSTFVAEREHGLTISDFLYIVFENNYLSSKVIITTLGGTFVTEYTEFPSLESYGYPSLQNGTGSTEPITDVELTYTCSLFRKPIWVIGDSYTSVYEERWPYQMVKTCKVDKTFLLIGKAGGGSAEMYGELQKALNFGTPKFLVWCLGMNDSYTTWNTYFNKVKTLCESKGAELILQTIPIPNLNTSQEQVNINSAIKASGYRYIDACAAMSPTNSWPWYSGYAADNVHPTVLGAKVLAARFLSDFPEFMQ